MTKTGFILFNFSATQNINNITGSSFGNSFATLCLTACPAYYYVDYSRNSSNCLLCDQAIVNCLNCTSKNACILCKPIAALFNQRCTICAIFM